MAYSKNRRLAEIVSDTSGNLSVEGIVVPTQSNSDNDTSAASTAFVHAHIDAVLDSAPGTLNTLNEIAAALNDDANFNTTVTNAIAAKAPLANPDFTGQIQVSNAASTIQELTVTGNNTRSTLRLNSKDSSGNSVDLRMHSLGDGPRAELFTYSNHDLAFATNNGAPQMTLKTSGNFGIGVSDPDADLEVRATTVVSGASDTVNSILMGLQSANRPTIILDTADTTYTNRTWNITNVGSAGSLFIGRNGLDVMTMTNDGNVGIGTSSPEKALHIISASNQLRLEDSTNDKKYDLNVDGDKFMIDDMTAGANRFAISGANVGIGTSSPANNLHIHTDSGDEGLTIKSTGDTSNAIIIDANRGNAGAAINALTGKWNGTSVADILFLTGADTTNKDDGVITFRTSSADNIAERMRINSVGEVGIRTTSLGAEATLHIGKPSGASNAEGGQLVLQSSTDGSLAPHFDAYTNASVDYLRLLKGTDTASSAVHTSFDLTNVRVGIGVSAPATSLHIANAGNSFLTLERTGTSGGTGKFGINMEGGSSQQTTMAYDDGGKLIIGRSSDPATQAGFNNDFILKGGFVGIKTLDPQVELHVTGNANISGSTTTGGIITGNHIIRSDAGHSTARVEAVYDDGAAQYDSNILMWVSEPGYTYDSGGIGVNVHASGHYYGRKYDNDYAVFTRFIKSDGSIQFAQNQGTSGTAGASQTETLKILADGKLRLATTGGIGFGTTNAANLLDDYEEGNFTPTFAASGGTAPSSQTGTGQYTKIGDVVHITGQIVWNGAGSGGGNLYISIPFNLISDARAGLAIGLNSGVNYAQDHTLHLVPEINTNVIYLVSTHYSVSGHTHLTYSAISNTGSKIFSFSGSFHTRD